MTSLNPELHPYVNCGIKENYRKTISHLLAFRMLINILIRDIFEDNTRSFKLVPPGYDSEGGILCATEVNRADCFVAALQSVGIGTDVAGRYEMRGTLGFSILSNRIGPSRSLMNYVCFFSPGRNPAPC